MVYYLIALKRIMTDKRYELDPFIVRSQIEFCQFSGQENRLVYSFALYKCCSHGVNYTVGVGLSISYLYNVPTTGTITQITFDGGYDEATGGHIN